MVHIVGRRFRRLLSAVSVGGDGGEDARRPASALAPRWAEPVRDSRSREVDAARHWFSVYSELYGAALAVRAGLYEIGACRRSQRRLEGMIQQLSGRLQFWREQLRAFEGS
jgi:hypothetical protein